MSAGAAGAEADVVIVGPSTTVPAFTLPDDVPPAGQVSAQTSGATVDAVPPPGTDPVAAADTSGVPPAGEGQAADPGTQEPSADPFAGFTRVPPPDEPIAAVGKADGEATATLQRRLLDLGFWLEGTDGTYGVTTRQAVMAFQKYNLLPATGIVDQATADSINAMPIRVVATAREGDLTEVDKERQLLFFVRGGVTLWALNTSTGNGEPYSEPDQNTPGEIATGIALTPDGTFKVNRQREEGWWEGDLGKIYRPKYFVGGIAVHGSGNVPNYPASHGCVRVTVKAMDYIWAQDLMPMKSKVWVH